MKVSIGQAAKELGVSIPTLRRWEAQGKIKPERTPSGHRRYDLAQLRGLKPYETSKTNRPTLCYARVSSHDQKEDLVRQVQLLETQYRITCYEQLGERFAQRCSSLRS